MKLLVTGGAGFIGSNFIRYWLHTHPDDEIINFDKLTYAGNLQNVSECAKNPRYSFVQACITNVDVTNTLVEQCDVVVHFAAETHVDRSIHGGSEFVRTNVLGTQILLEAALRYDKRLHHVSTDEVYGQLSLNDSEKFNEQSPYNPRSPYAASKAASDHLVRAFFHTHNLEVTISNCSNNFGPYQYPEKLIPLVITNLLENKKVPVYGDGKNVRDWLYVDDHCAAIDAILQKGKIGETYCIGGMTEDVSNLALVKKIITLLGNDESAIEFVPDRLGHDRRYAIDWSKAKRELNYEPQHDFNSALAVTVRWYQEHPEWLRRVTSGDYRKTNQQL
jgi:dTDP-glucose 4,6-dehydratase